MRRAARSLPHLLVSCVLCLVFCLLSFEFLSWAFFVSFFFLLFWLLCAFGQQGRTQPNTNTNNTMASFDRSQWNIFTCERVFEPPLLSSGGGASEERLSSLQSSISFPGLRAPSGDVRPFFLSLSFFSLQGLTRGKQEIERPLGLSLGKIFVASISPLFGGHIQALQAAPADASVFLKTIETGPLFFFLFFLLLCCFFSSF